MRITRSPREIMSKIQLKSFVQLARLMREVKDPVSELLFFVGAKEFEPKRELHLRSGYKIKLTSETDFRQSFWDCWIRDPYLVRSDDQVIIDAGANIGCFSIYAATKAPRARVHALEPSRRNLACLRENIALNSLGERVTAYDFGVAGKTGTLNLNTEHASPYHSAFAPGGKTTESIPVQSLTDMLQVTVGGTEVDLLKMDCEGGEMDCLLAASPDSIRRAKRIAVEYHEWAGFSFSDLEKHLEAAGFALRGRNHTERDRTGTALFVRD